MPRFTPTAGSRRRPASSLWHWSSPHGGRALPATLRCGARTFLTPTGCPARARPSDRLADLPILVVRGDPVDADSNDRSSPSPGSCPGPRLVTARTNPRAALGRSGSAPSVGTCPTGHLGRIWPATPPGAARPPRARPPQHDRSPRLRAHRPGRSAPVGRGSPTTGASRRAGASPPTRAA